MEARPSPKSKAKAKGEARAGAKRTQSEAKVFDEGSRMKWLVRFPDGTSKAFKYDTHNRDAKRLEAMEYMEKVKEYKGVSVVQQMPSASRTTDDTWLACQR